MADEISSNNTEVFVYTEGAVVPDDVVRIRVHPSVTIISEEAFYKRRKLEEVELCEGLLEVGKKAFMECDVMRKLELYEGLLQIGDWAFYGCKSLEYITTAGKETFPRIIQLPDSIESVGNFAFASATRLTQLRIPPLITTIPKSMISCSKTVFSIELPTSGMQLLEGHFLPAISYEILLYLKMLGLISQYTTAHFIYAQTYCSYLRRKKNSSMR